jgi:hypothetical protein
MCVWERERIFKVLWFRLGQHSFSTVKDKTSHPQLINTLRMGDANLRFLRFCITTVKDE